MFSDLVHRLQIGGVPFQRPGTADFVYDFLGAKELRRIYLYCTTRLEGVTRLKFDIACAWANEAAPPRVNHHCREIIILPDVVSVSQLPNTIKGMPFTLLLAT